jgi:hypothetical protein
VYQTMPCKYLKELVGAARFELTIPCAQGGLRLFWESSSFQLLLFQ